MRENAWAYPILETLHIFGLAIVFGGMVILDLRLLGFGSALPADRLARHVLPLVWFGFGLNVISGSLLFASDAVEFASNTSLRVKLALLAAAGLNAFFYQRFEARRRASSVAPSLNDPTRVFAVVSLLLWVGVVTAGRMIAYIK